MFVYSYKAHALLLLLPFCIKASDRMSIKRKERQAVAFIVIRRLKIVGHELRAVRDGASDKRHITTYAATYYVYKTIQKRLNGVVIDQYVSPVCEA